MVESTKRGVERAFLHLLRPLVRILLRNGISFREFADIVKRVYVDVAAEHAVGTRKVSYARIAILTGLTRKEVARVLQLDYSESNDREAPSPNRAARVLTGWHTDPDFTGPYGLPLELSVDERPGVGQGFTELVRRYSGDMPPRAMLDELLRVNAVKETQPGWIRVLTRAYVPHKYDPNELRRMGTAVHDFIDTVDFNLQKEGPGKGRFERSVHPDFGLLEEDMPALDGYLRQRAQQFLEDLDDWFSTRRRPQKGDLTTKTGVGVYHYVERGEPHIRRPHEQGEGSSE